MTYNKPLKTITVDTRGGSEFTATDELKKPIASEALDEFSLKQTMHIKDETAHFVPFHAVDVVEVTVTMASVNKGNPYGCEASSGDSTVCEAKACACTVGC